MPGMQMATNPDGPVGFVMFGRSPVPFAPSQARRCPHVRRGSGEELNWRWAAAATA
jgi:hypothetical protein